MTSGQIDDEARLTFSFATLFLFIHASFTRRVRSGALRAQHRQVDATCRQLALNSSTYSRASIRERRCCSSVKLVEAPGLHLGKVDAIDKPLPRIRQVELRTPPLARVRSAAVKEPRIEDDGGARSSRRLDGPACRTLERPRPPAMILWHGYLVAVPWRCDVANMVRQWAEESAPLSWSCTLAKRVTVSSSSSDAAWSCCTHRHMNRRSQKYGTNFCKSYSFNLTPTGRYCTPPLNTFIVDYRGLGGWRRAKVKRVAVRLAKVKQSTCCCTHGMVLS